MKLFFTLFLNCLIQQIVFAQGEPLPYTTGFDNVSEQAGWQEFRTGYLSTYSWNYGGPGFSAPSCLSHDYNVGGNPGDIVVDWFVSPPLNVTSTGTVSMKVKTAGFSAPTNDNCEIWFGTNDPDPTTGNFVLIGNISYMQPQYQWLDTTFNIPVATDSGYIAIRYTTVGPAWTTYQIDNINAAIFVGIDENENLNQASLSIFPNPFSDITTIQTNDQMENATMTIYNSSGQIVKEISGINGKLIMINKDDLQNGLYFIRLTQADEIIATEKLIITE